MSDERDGDATKDGEDRARPDDEPGGGDERSDDEDPFEQLEADVGDREGDPFENLTADTGSGEEGAPSDEAGSWDGEPGDVPPSTDPSTALSDPISGPGAPGRQADDADSTAPGDETASSGMGEEAGAEMAFGVGPAAPGGEESDPLAGSADREGDPFEALDGAFEEMDVGELDPDTVWQDLASAESRGSVGEPAQRTYADVSKHSYCEQCEYFSGPPEIACQHEGTEIVEFLDMETVRVVDCPIVAERAELKTEKSVALQDEDES